MRAISQGDVADVKDLAVSTLLHFLSHCVDLEDSDRKNAPVHDGYACLAIRGADDIVGHDLASSHLVGLYVEEVDRISNRTWKRRRMPADVLDAHRGSLV